MDLSRAIGKFAGNTILGWDAVNAAWVDTCAKGGLQSYDRFITERSFGQKKRVLTVAGNTPIAAKYEIVKVKGGSAVYLLESMNEDLANETVYAQIFLLHEAAEQVSICELIGTTRPSGIDDLDTESVIETTWMGLDRYSSRRSREFDTTEYSIVTLTAAPSAALTTDRYVKTSNGTIYDVNEVSINIDLQIARAQKRGVA